MASRNQQARQKHLWYVSWIHSNDIFQAAPCASQCFPKSRPGVTAGGQLNAWSFKTPTRESKEYHTEHRSITGNAFWNDPFLAVSLKMEPSPGLEKTKTHCEVQLVYRVKSYLALP